jgi:hypothetical protein
MMPPSRTSRHTNWESAATPARQLQIADASAARLFKIHGCARKSASNAGVYRTFIVATENEVAGWTTNAASRPFREALRNMLRERPVIFVGLSGQDFNLKVQVIAANGLTGSFDVNSPRVGFAESVLTTHHQTILQGFYSESGYAVSCF